MIQAVIFDIGGVLLTLGEAEYRQGVAGKLGLPALPAEYDVHMPALQRGELAEGEVWARLAGRPVPEDAFDRIWQAHFLPIPDMLSLARDLRAQGVRTAILSNTQASHVRIMRTMGFLEGFDPVCLSCEIGARKPEPEAYRHVLRRLRLPAAAVAYVDDIPEYVEAGRGLGIQAVWHRDDPAATRRTLLGMLDRGVPA